MCEDRHFAVHLWQFGRSSKMASEYSPEVVADLQAMVRQGVSAWGVPTSAEVKLLNLSENATFLVCDPAAGKADLVLRLHRVGYSSDEEIRSELAWVAALGGERAVEIAQPVAGENGEYVQVLASPGGRASRHAVAFERVPGREPEAGADLTFWFSRLGAITARMHGHARRWPRPAWFKRRVWDFAAMVGPHAYWGPWRDGIGLSAGGAATIARALAKIADRLDAFGKGPERFGLVHADLRLANLLVEGPHLRVIDFDDCGFSWFAYDFAASVSFIECDPMLPALMRAWIDGYRTVAPFGEEETAMLPYFVALRRILLTAWLASHHEIPFARTQGAEFTAGTVTVAEAMLAGKFLS
jgi:Ser/Thr protein kinase RdoA (MazF antagonist)